MKIFKFSIASVCKMTIYKVTSKYKNKNSGVKSILYLPLKCSLWCSRFEIQKCICHILLFSVHAVKSRAGLL